MSSHILKKLYNISVYTIGVCVLLAATVASLIRIALPDIGMYRSEVEAWVSNYMELPVVIHSINAHWSGWTPYLYLEEIDLMNSTGTEPIIFFKKANISIDLLSSLLSRQIVPEQLVISGLDINVTRLKDGSIDIAGIRVGSYKRSRQSNEELGNWFFNQSHISLRDANITWLDMKHQQPSLQLTGVSLDLRSDGKRLQLEGSSFLPDGYGSNMNFAIDVTGNLLSPEWSAEVFLQANNIQPDNWYRQYWPEKLILSGGDASISLWSNVSNTRINSFRGKLEYNDVAIFTEDRHVINIEKFSSDFNGEYQNEGEWKFNIHLSQVQTENKNWPETDLKLHAINIHRAEQLQLELDFSYLNIADLQRFIPLIPNLPSSIAEYSASNHIDGELRSGNIRYIADAPVDERIQVDFSFTGLNTELLLTEPRISGLSGKISGSSGYGEILFDNEQAIVEHFRGDDMVSVSGSVKWQKNENTAIFSSDNLLIANQQIHTRLTGSVKHNDEGSFVDIIIEANGDKIQNVIQYMPYSSRFRARDWIASAVPAGALDEFKLILRGNPANFPFDNNDGQFVATARVSSTVLDYSPKFPAITNIDAGLLFQGRKMQIDIQSGKIFDSYFSGATANIPNLFVIKKDLNIDGIINGPTADLKSYISESPLKDDLLLAKINDSLSATGSMQLALDLMIPLRNPDKHIGVKGRLGLEDAEIVSNTNNLKLTHLNGEVQFTEDSLLATDMAAVFDGNEVVLSIEGSKNTSGAPASVTISGQADQDFIGRQIDTYFPAMADLGGLIKNNLTGRMHWEASLLYTKDEASHALRRNLQLRSDMIGMAVDLPAPLAKKNYESVTLEFRKDLDAGAQDRINLKYGDINTELIYVNRKLQQTNIVFGETKQNVSGRPGINVFGTLPYLNINNWLKLMPGDHKSIHKSVAPAVNTDIVINSLEYLGQTFSNTTIRAGNADGDWRIVLDSPEVQGSIKLAKQADGKNHFIADLDSLIINRGSTGGATVTNPASLPSMLVHVDSFRYDNIDLGELKLTAVPTANGLLIEDISFHKDNMHIRANGTWNNNRYTGSASSFFIDVHANEINHLLDTFGFSNNSISRAETKLTINANWPGTPFNFALAKLNGTIDLDMKKGALLDIQPAAGRLFGLLSLQTLPRRLVLDFSDLFGEGMAFDSIRGGFSVKDGNAYTDNLAMKGPSVNIDISGRTGLSVKDYDQLAVITPQISSSLAVASGFLGPVGIGLGTVLYLASNIYEPLEDGINKIMKVEYNIKGSWDNPVVERSNDKTDS